MRQSLSVQTADAKLDSGTEVTLLVPEPGGAVCRAVVGHWSSSPTGLITTITLRASEEVVTACSDGRVWLSGRTGAGELLVIEAIARAVTANTLGLTSVTALAREPRRGAVRTRQQWPVQMTLASKTVVLGTTLDVSSTGCRVAVNLYDETTADGQRVRLSMRLPDTTWVHTPAQICWRGDNGEMSLRFDADETDRVRLDREVLTATSATTSGR